MSGQIPPRDQLFLKKKITLPVEDLMIWGVWFEGVSGVSHDFIFFLLICMQIF